MRRTLFRGNDDGFTFIGAIVFLLVLLLLVPAVSALLAGGFETELSVLDRRQQLFEERQSQLDSEQIENWQKMPLPDALKTGGGL